MTIKELCKKLNKYPENLQVFIVDGFEAKVYHGDFLVQDYTDEKKVRSVEICIAGLEVSDDSAN